MTTSMIESIKRTAKEYAWIIKVFLLLITIGGAALVIWHAWFQSQKMTEYQATENTIDSLLSIQATNDSTHLVALEKIELTKAMLANKNYPSLMGKICLKEALMARSRHQYPQSIDHFKQAIPFFKQRGDDKQLSRIFHYLGSNYKKTGDFNQSFEASLKALSLYKTHADQHKLRRSDTNNRPRNAHNKSRTGWTLSALQLQPHQDD